MFNLFKRKPSVATINATIEKIHGEFDSASENLLKEAKAIVARNKDANKGNRLIALGFSSAAPVAQSKENREKEELAAIIEYFQTYYPNNKFITEDAVKAICDKYGLVFGESHFYKGDVPEKNLTEMEAFKLRDEDKIKRSNVDDFYQRRQLGLMAQALAGRPAPSYNEVPKEVAYRFIQPAFKICAPEKDFDTRHMVKKDGYKLEYDPIVLQPVKMGYLIVTKWGLEGQDSSLINEKQN